MTRQFPTGLEDSAAAASGGGSSKLPTRSVPAIDDVGRPQRTPPCGSSLRMLPENEVRQELADAVRRAGGRVAVAKVERALEVLAELGGRPVSMAELGRSVGVSRGRVVVAPLVDVGLVVRVTNHSPAGRQTASSFEVTPAGHTLLEALLGGARRPPSARPARPEVLGRLQLRAPLVGNTIHPTNLLGARGAHDARDLGGEPVTEALEAVLAAYERATGAAAVVVNRQVLEGVIVDAQARGCSAQDLLAATTGDYAGARNPAGVLIERLRAVSPAPASDPGDAGAEVAARVRHLVQNWAATGIDRDAIVEHSTASMPAASKADVEAAVDLELAATELTA